MEGFDIRTLAMTNLILGGLLSIGSVVFAKVHSSFRGFYQLGVGYFLFAFGYILFASREHINDFLSIVIANLLIASAFTIVIVGILNFLNYPKRKFIKISIFLLVIITILFIFFTYIQPNVNTRIIIISSFISGQAFFATYKTYYHENSSIRLFIQLLAASCFFCALAFLCRIVMTFNSLPIINFMDAGYIDAISMIALQIFVVSTCLSLSWSASQQLAQKLKIQATIDLLTNLYNRRAFEEFAEKEVSRAEREQTYISVVLMDIDLFKQVNDTHGHQIGDKVLQEFSVRLKDSLRQYDILARYGGEEFMLLLPDTDRETALVIAEKLRVTIFQPVFCVEKELKLEVSASFGVASICGKTIDWKALVAKADSALYQAKSNGRNQVHCL
ncbi:MAG: diguanylate cyclase (GGDEF)-like protein [Colwellia sp.]|jgi:diguanylate cyclase (GGDEF)-like protein